MLKAVIIGFLGLAFAVALGWILLWAVNYSLDQNEQVNCLKWAREAREYPDYYIKDWQKSQCDRHEIVVDAPVK